MAKYSEETKLKAFGLIKAEVPPKEIGRELTVPYQTILAWKKEFKRSEEKAAITQLVNTDKAVINQLTHSLEEEFEELEEESSTIVSDVVEKLDGLSLLQDDLQKAGIKLTKKISELSENARTPIELEILVGALSKLQVAFFAKGANVNVLNMQGGVSNTGISAFKTLQRDA